MINTAEIIQQNRTLLLKGSWTQGGFDDPKKNPLKNLIFPTYPVTLDASGIDAFDSVGALMLNQIIQQLRHQKIKINLTGLKTSQQKLLSIIEQSETQLKQTKPESKSNILERIGKNTVGKFTELAQWMTFIGEVTVISLRLLRHPWRIKWKYLAAVVEIMGFRALPIIAFLSFLIGVVLTYQIGLELKLYGANIYIVDLLGLAIFREFGPLITAIILAGRTASAFTAQIGLMQANEEIDALRTMGLSPTALLIFPRIFALILIMPLLTVWANIFGILGGMLMAKFILGISFYSFILQFPEVVTLTSFIIGLCKAPVFAMIIASVGCYQGLKVSGSSESIGWQTTKSVVLTLFLIIIADAIFSVVLSWWNI